MPTIEQLNFDLIINDKQFNTQVQKALKDARDLNTQLSTLLNLRKQFAGAARGAAADERDLARAIEEQTRRVKENSKAIQAGTSAARAYNAERRKMKSFNMTGGDFSGSKGSLSELTSLAAQYVSILGGAKLVKAITQVTAEFELQRTTLRAILQDIEGADAIFSQIKSLAVMSPFSFKELVTYAEQLSAYSIPMGELYETTKMLADVSAGLGVGMDRLVLAYGQIRSASFLRGQEVRQLTEAGIPILEELRKQFVELGEEGITVGDVFDKISNRMVPFEMVSKVFQNMTSEGGKFYQMQEVQAETLRGKISNLKDAYDIMFDKIGNKNMGALKGAVDWVRSLAENYQRTGRWLAELIALYGTYKVALALAAAGEKAVAAVNTITRITQMARTMKAMTGQTHLFAVALRTLGASGMKTALAGIAGGFALIVTWIVKAIRNAGEFQRELNKLVNEKYSGSEKLAGDFQRLVQRLREATVGSGDYRRAISELNNKYGEYLPNLLTEKNALAEIAKEEQSVTNAIYARAKAYAETEGMQRIEEKYGKQLDVLYSGIVGFISPNLGKEQAERFAESFKNHIMHTDDPLNIGAYFEQFFGKDIYSVFKENTQDLIKVGGDYIKQVQLISKEYDKLTKKIDDRWGNKSVYSSEAQYQATYKIEEDFAKKEAAIKNKSLTAEEEKQALLDNEIAKLEAIKRAYEGLNKEAADLGNPGAWNNLIDEVQKKLDALRPKDSTWLQRIVNAYVTGNSVNDLKVKQEDKYSEYLDNLRKEYKAVVAEVKDAEGTYNKLVSDKKRMTVVDEDALKKAKQQLDNLSNRKKVIEDIGRALGVSVNDKVKTTSSSGKSTEQIELETRINTMKDLLSWYEKLKDAGMGEGQIKSVLSQFFPDEADVINGGNYKEILLEMATALEKYGDAAKKTAQGLREDVAGTGLNNVIEAFKEMQKAAKDFADYMNSWKEGGILDGTGVNFDVTKIISTYQKKLQEITKKEEEARKRLYDREKTKTGEVKYGLTFSSDYNEITSLATRDIQDAMAQANNSIQELAQKWVKEWAEINGAPLEDWSQLTISQLKAVKEALDQFYEDTGEISEDMLPDAIKKLKEEYPQLYKQFVDALGKSVSGTEKKLEAVTSKEKIKMLKETVSKILELTDSFEELAAAAGSSAASDVMSAVSGIGSTLKDAAQGFASGGWIGAILAVVVDLGKELISCITYSETLKSTLESAKVDALVQSWEDAMNSSTGIFGTNTITRLNAAHKVLKESREELSKLYDELSQQDVAGYFANSWLMPLTTLENTLYNLIAGKSNDLKAYEEAIAKGYSGIEAYILKTVDYSGFSNFIGVRDQFASLKDVITGLGYEMYDVYGNLNADALQAILDTYEKLGAEDRAWMEEAIKYSNEYKAAMEELDSTISDQLSSTITSLVDEMYDSFLACGDAAANVGDAIGEWETSLYKSLIAGMMMDEWEKEFGDRIRDLYTRFAAGENVESELELIDREMEDSANMWANFSNAIWENLGSLGALESSGGSNLASGISSITEDTANLLASYINAMRSDLAGHRMEVQGISTDVKALLGLMPSAPTLAEYLTQIQANTYNTSANTAEILARLDSVVGDGASSYIRIQ